MTHQEHYTTRQLMERYSVCRRTLTRWTEQVGLNFPKPLRINGRRYWKVDEISQWEEARKGAA